MRNLFTLRSLSVLGWFLLLGFAAVPLGCARGRGGDDRVTDERTSEAGASASPFGVPPYPNDLDGEPSVSEAPGLGNDGGSGPVPGGEAGALADASVEGSAPLAPAAGPGEAGAADATPGNACARPLAAGDLAIVELAVSTTKGTGDHGEWLEVQSTADCALDLRGLHGDCPVGSKVNTFDVTSDVWLPPHGTFVVADSTDPVVNHGLGGVVFAWAGEPGDTLRNLGGTISLSAGAGGPLLEAATYPEFTLETGVSVTFPADCPLGSRGDFSLWQYATASYFPGFLGTPNAPNDDAPCPAAAPSTP